MWQGSFFSSKLIRTNLCFPPLFEVSIRGWDVRQGRVVVEPKWLPKKLLCYILAFISGDAAALTGRNLPCAGMLHASKQHGYLLFQDQ